MKSLEEFCKENGKEFLLEEWDYDKNQPLTPQSIGFGSNKKVAWKCVKGHKWDATVGNRSRWSNCPFCAGKRVSEDNSLEKRFPYVAKEWCFEKNGELTPTLIAAGSEKKVWWVCSAGHTYQASVYARTIKKTQCPYCRNQRVLQGYNDLETTNPELLVEWDYEKNIKKPSEVIAGSNKKVWWLCKAGHSYEASIYAKKNGAGCPYCNKQRVSEINSLANCDLRVAALWDYEKNYPITPDKVAVKSSKRFCWKCSKGHMWDAKVSDLTAGNTGCPYCSGKRVTNERSLQFLFPQIAKQWDYRKNTNTPMQVSAYSQKKAWWICPKGHSWCAVIGNRTRNNTDCPFCNNKSTSFPEQAILFYCKKVYDEVISRDTLTIGRELDVFIPRIGVAIEYDGARWHKGDEKSRKEKEKDGLCYSRGIKLYRVIESGVKNEHDDSVTCIYLTNSSMSSLENAIKRLFKELKISDLIDIDLKRDQLKIREAYMQAVVDGSLAIRCPQIATEWDYDKNGNLTPEMFSPGSSNKVWWKCNMGHSWKAEIGSRTAGRGCPYCAHKKASKEYNLETQYPRIAAEWDYDRNGSLRPIDMLPHSTKKAWWICPKGHSYLMTINQRTKDECNCPYCSGRRINADNNFSILFPELLKEWDYDKNATLSPRKIGKGCGEKVWWICPRGHSYQMTVKARTLQGQGCMYCAGKRADKSNCLATKRPKLIKEWDYEKNGDDTPYNVVSNSTKKVWWICSRGHSYRAIIANRYKGSGCPYCSTRIARKIQNIDTGEVYNNITDAANRLNCSVSGIMRSCRNGKTIKGFRLKYIEH